MTRIICEAVVDKEITMKSLQKGLRKTHASYNIYDTSVRAELSSENLDDIRAVRDLFECLDNHYIRQIK